MAMCENCDKQKEEIKYSYIFERVLCGYCFKVLINERASNGNGNRETSPAPH